MADNLKHPYNQRQVATIDVLHDDVLLTIFDFYVAGYQDLDFTALFTFRRSRREIDIESWQSLVHVCRRWRGLVFQSPRRLNLQLCCTPDRFARKTLDVWPALPLLIRGTFYNKSADNIIAKLEHSDRIREFNLDWYSTSPTTSQIEKLWTAMRVPFPELGALRLSFGTWLYVPVVPDSFLGGSAPRLRSLSLAFIPFPGLPELLLSATHLVNLWLVNIPHSGYISPEAMATCVSVLTSLESFRLEFEYPQSSPDQESQRPPSPTRSILPALSFWFKGVNEYLEDFVSRIDAPRLYQLRTTFFNDIYFDTPGPELNRFISRTPTFGTYDEAHLIFRSDEALVNLRSHHEPSDLGTVK